jgi:hypothetical protein
MVTFPYKLKRIAIVTGAVGALLTGGSLLDAGKAEAAFINEAQAAEGKGNQGSGQKQKGKLTSQKGKRSGKKDIRDVLAAEEDEDSDRPPWAGVPGKEGKPGGGSSGSDRKKGGDYGDIWIILRNDDGTPKLDANGNVQPCLDPACTEYIQLTADGELPPEYADKVIEVEFGRLNIARSPDRVLTHALEEALSKLDGGVYGTTVTLDPAGRLVVDGSTIDSPLENLALYASLLTAPAVNGVITLSVTVDNEGGGTTTYSFSIPESDRLDLAASAFAAASDKTGNLTVDSIMGISGFMEVSDALSNVVSSYSYDRTTTYANVQVWIMYEVSPGVLVPKLVNILDVVTFNTLPAIDGDADGIDKFAQAADDALQVLEYIHANAIDQ